MWTFPMQIIRFLLLYREFPFECGCASKTILVNISYFRFSAFGLSSLVWNWCTLRNRYASTFWRCKTIENFSTINWYSTHLAFGLSMEKGNSSIHLWPAHDHYYISSSNIIWPAILVIDYWSIIIMIIVMCHLHCFNEFDTIYLNAGILNAVAYWTQYNRL